MNIFNIIYRRFVPAPTVASIMSGFTKSIDKLEALAEDAAAREEAAAAAITAAQKARVDATVERGHAKSTANKLREFIS